MYTAPSHLALLSLLPVLSLCFDVVVVPIFLRVDSPVVIKCIIYSLAVNNPQLIEAGLRIYASEDCAAIGLENGLAHVRSQAII